MTRLYTALFAAIASATHRELARQVRYLKVENEILRRKLPGRITVTPTERRRLVRFALRLGRAARHLVSIVAPGTLLRWIREEKRGRRKPVPRRGRRRKPEDIRRLIVKLARENDWGYTRILGELKKLGIRSVSKNTVKRILKEHGIDPGPKRGAGTWDDFLQRHAVSLWQCDFLTRRVVSYRGIREMFVLVFIHVRTRQVVITPATRNPNDAWIVQQTEQFVADARRRGLRVGRVQHDRDSKFSRAFRAALRRRHVKSLRSCFCAPNMNAFVERFLQSLQRECLDHFIILGPRHLDHLCREYLAHYHAERPHQSLDNEPVVKPPGSRHSSESGVVQFGELRCRSRLGGRAYASNSARIIAVA